MLTQVLSLPTAPFVERAPSNYIRGFCDRRGGVALTADRAGNLLIRYRRGRRVAHPVCLTAHLDHPGFVADRMTGRKTLRALWRGGVRRSYFDGAKVRFRADGRWRRGVIERVRARGRADDARVESVDVRVSAAIPAGAVGMWDLPDPSIGATRIRARACDDLAGVAGMLCCIDELCRRKPDGEGYFLFTRAEEVGFVGAMAACRLKTIPSRCVVVAVETSSERPDARIGDGPVLRVGDRSAVFSAPATAFCRTVADELARRDRSFAYQRKLMDGGTCESSAYCDFGYTGTGICLALGNYHNMNVRRGRIDSEYVGTADFESLVKWFVALVRSGPLYTDHDASFRRRLRSLEREYAGLLEETARSVH